MSEVVSVTGVCTSGPVHGPHVTVGAPPCGNGVGGDPGQAATSGDGRRTTRVPRRTATA